MSIWHGANIETWLERTDDSINHASGINTGAHLFIILSRLTETTKGTRRLINLWPYRHLQMYCTGVPLPFAQFWEVVKHCRLCRNVFLSGFPTARHTALGCGHRFEASNVLRESRSLEPSDV